MAEIFDLPSPRYEPAMRVITAITQASPAAITTDKNHEYGTGMIVKILIPTGFGMPEINKKTGVITVTGDKTFTINIDSSGFTAFSVPAQVEGTAYQHGQVVPTGEVTSTFDFATRNVK